MSNNQRLKSKPTVLNYFTGASRLAKFVRLVLVSAVCLLLMTASSTSPSQARSMRHAWEWPLFSPTVIGRFDPPEYKWLAGHRGIDLAGSLGDEVFAASDGEITFAGTLANKDVVVVTHGSLRTTYEPVAPVVSVGQRVSKGELIGHLTVGASHCASENSVVCLHWGLRRGHFYLNPLLLVRPRPRLLPLWQ